MDIINACISLAPVPCLGLVFSTFRSLCTAIQGAQWSERQLRCLATSAAELLQILDEEIRTGRLAESRISTEVVTLEMLLKEINSFVQNEDGRGFLKLLFSKDERIAAIDVYHRRLCSCATAFQVSALVVIQDWQKRNDDCRETDRQILYDRLTGLEANQVKLREVLEVHQNNMVAMMTSLQKFVIKQLGGERERRFFSSALNHLADFSGKHVVNLESWMITSFDVEFGPEIGSGGFGQVFKGVWNRTQVALKVLKTDSGATPNLALIRREITTWSALLHPHILQFLGANVFDDRPFIVMPFLKNGNARDYVHDHPECNRMTIVRHIYLRGKRMEHLPISQLHHISLGLVYLHHNNVIHGDLKALNVLIDDAGHAVLCDFGLSHIKSDATTRSVSQKISSVVGSRNWMSPERIMGGDLRKYVDIYAFGMTMFEILTGKVPLGHIAYVDFIVLVVDKDIRPERPDDDRHFKISDSVWSLAEACWAKSPQDRPTALAICDMISTFPASPLAVPEIDVFPSFSLDATTSSSPEATLTSIIPQDAHTLSSTSGSTSAYMVDDDLGTVASSMGTESSASKTSRRKASRWNKSAKPEDTSRIKMIHSYTETATGNNPSDRECVAGKQNPFRRMTSWFGTRLPNAQARSLSPVQEVSGFRIALGGHLISDSRDSPGEMWSLDELLDRWVTRSSDIVKDNQFQDIFLGTYPCFTNCLEVFEGLRLRFDAALTGDLPAQTRAFRRYSIISALKYWIESPYIPVDPDVLSQMKEFANSVISSSFMSEKAKQITEVIDGKIEENPLPALSESVANVKALLDNSSEQIARSLTALEGIMFSRIHPADYINHLRELQGPNRVADACISTLKITLWVKQKVLRSEHIKRRGKAFKFFLKTAEDCYEMRNFSSTAAIVVALESEPIQCLPETLRELDNQDRMLLAKLSSFVRSESAYRAALNSSEDPCVPHLKSHLRDLKTDLLSCLPNNGKMVNIMGCIALAAQMRDLIRIRTPDMAPEPERLTYLLKQLASIEVSTTTDDQLHQRSRLLKARETDFSKSRARALEVIGA